MQDIKITYFESFGIEHVPKEIKKCIRHKNIQANIFRIQGNNSVIFLSGFTDLMHGGKALIGYTNLFSPYNFEGK